MDYYEKVSDLQNKLSARIKALTEAQRVISPSSKDRETYPGLIDGTPKKKQYELLTNAWIILKQIDDVEEFGSDIDELFASLNELGNCPVKCEPAFQGFEVGQ